MYFNITFIYIYILFKNYIKRHRSLKMWMNNEKYDNYVKFKIFTPIDEKNAENFYIQVKINSI